MQYPRPLLLNCIYIIRVLVWKIDIRFWFGRVTLHKHLFCVTYDHWPIFSSRILASNLIKQMLHVISPKPRNMHINVIALANSQYRIAALPQLWHAWWRLCIGSWWKNNKLIQTWVDKAPYSITRLSCHLATLWSTATVTNSCEWCAMLQCVAS